MRKKTAREVSTDGFCEGRASALSPSLGELVAIGLLDTPCCGHIALCDGLCRDASLPRERDGRRIGSQPR
jgi:hypothetical protein